MWDGINSAKSIGINFMEICGKIKLGIISSLIDSKYASFLIQVGFGENISKGLFIGTLLT
jgi:hypothetical protein